jgi:hypothetical protein
MIRIALAAARAAVIAAPLVWKIGIVAGGIAVVMAATVAWKHSIYQSGYNDAIKDVAARNAEAADAVRRAVERPRACRDGGGVWDQSRGLCDR